MPGLATKVWEETKRKSFCLAEAVCSRGPYGAPEEPYNAPDNARGPAGVVRNTHGLFSAAFRFVVSKKIPSGIGSSS